MTDTERETFHWIETASRLASLLVDVALEPDRGGVFRGVGADGREVWFQPPLVVRPQGSVTARTYLDQIPEDLGVQVVILMRAGVASLGLWGGEELVHHKVFRRYVVRGSGKAQSTHLKTKGKSRYGSRLRLQNHRRLLEEVNERLGGWWRDHAVERVFHAVPVRLWTELHDAVEPAPPFPQVESMALGLDVRQPSFEELRRVRRVMLRGTVEVRGT